MACSAVPATALISKAGSASIMRERTARATVESSTIIRRIGLACGRAPSKRSRDLASARSTRGLRYADELKLDVKRFAVERLHHIFVRACFKRGADVRHVVLGRAEDDLGLVGMTTLTQHLEELHAAHDWHVPIEQDDVRHLGFAASEGLLPVARFLNLELERFKDMPSDLPDHLGVVDDQTAFHAWHSPLRCGLIKH